MTEKLYYQDSHTHEFTATVLECREMKGGYAVILDRSAFFPGGGGQAADTGHIGGVAVTDAHEKAGELLHCCPEPLTEGQTLQCGIDWEPRLRRMQNHSGEHIVSGITHALHGFENVGFHMGAECMTIDFDGELEESELTEIETLANQAVRGDIPVRTWFPSPEELGTLEYRSKLELTENVRIVEIAGIDRCACCAPHVYRTGEIGVIKLLESQRHRGGVRISLVCGMDALDDYRAKQDNVTAVSRALSVKRNDTGAAVERMLREQQAAREHLAELETELVRHMAQAAAVTGGNVCIFDQLLGEAAQRELVNLLTERCPGLAAVFCGDDEEGYRYVIGSRTVDLRSFGRELNGLIGGKGGGSSQMMMGRASADRELIQKVVETAHV